MTDAAELRDRTQELLAAHSPATTDCPDFLKARFDAGLAWGHYPEGLGGPRRAWRAALSPGRRGRRTRAAARDAADALATASTDADVAVAVAQAYAAPVAVHAAEEAVQLHGNTGMSWEHPVHLCLKRAKAGPIAYGTAGGHREALAELVGLRAP